MKRHALFLTFLFALSMLLSSSCVIANAESIQVDGAYSYRLKGNGTAIIVDFEWQAEQSDIYIPSMIAGYSVTAIDDEAFADGKNVTNKPVVVVLPNTIATIGNKAFYNSPVSAINIPSSVQSIGEGAFAYCNISYFSVEPGHEYFASIEGVLYNKKGKSLIAYPQNSAKTISVPEGILSIGDWAFAGVTIGSFEYEESDDALQFTDILPKTIKEIGDYAFIDSTIYYGQSNNKTVYLLPDSVVAIGPHAFERSAFSKAYYRDQAPKNIVIGANVTQFGNYAFANCKWYDGNEFNLYLNSLNSIDVIGEYAFADSIIGSDIGTIEIVFPTRVGTIGAHAFESTYTINASIWIECAEILDYAFYNTVIYSEKVIGEYYQEVPTKLIVPCVSVPIGEGAFAMAENNYTNTITQIVLHDGLECIGDSAFKGLHFLQNIVFPNTLKSIGDSVFVDCDNLVDVTLPSSLSKIGDTAFMRTKIIAYVEEGSYPALWASENGYSYRYTSSDSLDWLNN